MNQQFLVVFCTVPNEESALKISNSVVESHLAACCNIIPALRSLYFWEGKVYDDSELLLVIKTKADRYELLENKIQELHPYDVPEIIALPIFKGNKDYLKWVDENVRKKPK